MDAPIDFFISYTGKDKTWAEWIAWTLEEAGYKTMIQAWDFHAASNFVLKMQQGTADTARTIAVITPDYFESAFTNPEWAVAFANDPTSEKGKLIPVRVADFKPQGLFKTIVYINLVGLDEAAAKKNLTDSIANIVKRTRMKPVTKPMFPGGKAPATHGAPPPFPGASAGTKTFLHNLPFSPNPFFTGRDKMLDDLHAALCKKTAAAITQPQAVHGLGGVGKTQLATEYAWRHQTEYDFVFWVGAASALELHANLANLADLLKLPEADAREQEVKVRAVLDWLRSNQRWLLILDNADIKEAQTAVQNILPAGLQGHVIVTSRRANWPVKFADLEVRVLPAPVAAEFLQHRSAKSGFNAGNKADAEAVTKELGCLPLALEQAGAYIARHHVVFAEYLRLLKASRAKLLADGSQGGTDYQKTVATTWLVSEAQLSPCAQSILQLAAFLAPDEIPRALFLHGSKVIAEAAAMLASEKASGTKEPIVNSDMEDALAELADHSLVELEAEAFSCHRLLQAVLLDRLKPDARRHWGKLAVQLVNAYVPADPADVRTWPIWNKLQLHADALLKNVGDDSESDAASLMNEFALLLKTKALYGEAEPLYRRALNIDEKSFGPEHPAVAIRLNNLASLLQATNRLAEAEPLMRRALAIAEKSFGPEHPHVAIDLNNLAQLLQDTNRLAKAEPLMRRALAIDEKSFGPEHPKVAIRLNNLAQLLQATNRLAEAEPFMRRALAIDEKSFGPEHPDVARDLNNLAQLLKDTKRLAEAEPLAWRAAAIFIHSLGLEHPNSQTLLKNYKGILTAMKFSEPEIQARLREVTEQSVKAA
jgi:tetratricopeptide (TPR) repeat protein